jgi:membrane protein YqaA with SNARE-associated domain
MGSTLKARQTIAALLLLAFLWGFSEATVFFIVPDVIISLIALIYGWRAGALAVCVAIAGAVGGGTIIYYWGQGDIVSARAFFDQLPAIAPATIARATNDVSSDNFGFAMLIGSVTSVPYKLYAAEAGAAGLSLWTFILLTPLARLPRFALAAIMASLADKYTPAFLDAHRIKLWALFWAAFYALYWSLAPN